MTRRRTISTSASGIFRCFPVVLCLLWLISPAVAQMRSTDTKHYRLRTDLEPRLANDLAWRMDALFEEYTLRLVNFSPPSSSRFDVYVFNLRKDYEVLTKDDFPNTAGIFVESRNLLAAFFEGQGRDQVRRTLQHEAFHQFAHTAISKRLPPWINEGLAQIFEEGLWVDRRLLIGQVPPRRIRQLQHDIREGKLVPFRDFLALSDEKWNHAFHDAPAAAAQYNQAWAMCHFLIFSPDESGQPRYRQRFINMLTAIHRGTPANRAFVEAFSSNIDGFQDRFLEFTRSLTPSREAMYVEYQSILADMLVVLEKEDQRFDEIESFRKYLSTNGMRLRYSKGYMQWSTESDATAYFRDAAGRMMTREQFYFSPRGGAPLPDMVVKPADGLQLRTVFHHGKDKIDHETVIERR